MKKTIQRIGKGMKKKIKFPPCEDILFIEDGGWLFQWCCQCHLRHIWRFHIVKDKGKQYIRMEGIADEKATELRRWYEKRK